MMLPWRTRAEREADDRRRAWSAAHTYAVLQFLAASRARIDRMIKQNEEVLATMR